MRTFQDLAQEVDLVKAFISKKGTLYAPKVKTGKRILIRHFDDGLFSEDLIKAYVDLNKEIKEWLNKSAHLKEYVVFEDIIEVGYDFVTIAFHILLSNSLWDYDRNIGKKHRYKFPEKLREIRKLFEVKLNDEKNEILKSVIKKSVLDSAKKTIYDYRINKLIIMEPEIDNADLRNWKMNYNAD